MIKRRRINSTGDEEPVVVIDSHYRLCITFLCIVKYVPIMKNCIPRDIAKKILGFIKVDLRGGIQTTKGEWLHLKCSASNNFWYWRIRDCVYRPCVGCLKPICTLEPGSIHFKLTCPKCISVANAHIACCGYYLNSISTACFGKFRLIYELPPPQKK